MVQNAGREITPVKEWLRRTTIAERLRPLQAIARLFSEYADWPERVPGVPIGMVDGSPVFSPLEGHTVTVGSSGEGKFTSAIAHYGLHDVRDAQGIASGMVFVDPKNGEAARITGPYRRQLREEQVFVLDPYNKAGGTDGLNPFDFLDPTAEDFYEACQGFANALVVQRPMDKRGNDFIWDSKGAEWLTAMIAHLALDPEEEKTLRRLRSIFAVEEEEFTAVLMDMKANPASPSWVRDMADDMSRVTRKAEREASGYIATIREATKFVDSAMMSRVLERSTFDPMVVRSHGATVYVVSHNGYLQQSAPWIRLMCEVIRQRISRTSINRHVHWIIDEAKAFDAWSFIPDGLRAMRSERISMHLFYQNLGQLKGVWGDGWSSITDVRMIRFLGSNDVETLEWIAKLAGEVSVVDYSQAHSESESSSEAHAEGRSESTATAHGVSKGTSTSDAEGETHGTNRGRSSARGTSRTKGRSRSASETRSRGGSHAVGRSQSITKGFSETHSESVTNGTSRSSGGSWGLTGHTSNDSRGQSSSKTEGYSYTTSESVTEGTSVTDSTNWSNAKGVTQGDSVSDGESETETTNSGSSESSTQTRTKGVSLNESDTTTRTDGSNTSRTLTTGDTDGKTETFTERRRLLTIDEVRRMSNRSVLLFIDRQPDCLVERLHYHETPPLVARVLKGQLAFAGPLNADG